MKEIVKRLNELKIKQTSIDWGESLEDDLYNEIFKGSRELRNDLDRNARRWYETSTMVVEIPQGIVGVVHVSNLYSECMTVSDVEHRLEFREMEEITLVSYRGKLN